VAAYKIAAVERRKARLPSNRQAGAFQGAQKMTLRRSGAPPPHGGNEDPGEKPGTRTGRADVRKARAARSRERAPFQPQRSKTL